MSNQRQQSESNDFKPSRLNRIFAIVQAVLCIEVLAFSVIYATFILSDPQSEGLGHFVAFLAIVLAFVTLLLLIAAVRNFSRAKEKSERRLSWKMLLYFLFISLIFGEAFFSLIDFAPSTAKDVSAFQFGLSIIGVLTGMARVFSLPSPEEKQHEHSD